MLGNCDESSDKHLVKGLRDGEVELRLVPNLGLLHAADALLHPNHRDRDSISAKLVQSGEHRTQLLLVTTLPWRWMITCTTHEHLG